MKNNYKFKSIFKEELRDFIDFKKSQGYIYSHSVCWLFKHLDDFFIEISLKKKEINSDTIEKWLMKSNNNCIEMKKRYYFTINMFTKYLTIKEYENITIPKNNPYHGKSNFIPYIYTKEEILSIFKNSKTNNLLYLALHFLYNCGLRISEVANLKIKNVDIVNKTILIEHSKNDRTRIIPLNDSIITLINDYVSKYNLKEEMYLFLNDKTRDNFMNYYLRKPFHSILKTINIHQKENGSLPRIHDLRHTFAVHTLEQMKNKGFDLYTSLPILSIYMGHKSIVETEYYLRLIPENSKSILNSKEYIENLYISKEVFHEE